MDISNRLILCTLLPTLTINTNIFAASMSSTAPIKSVDFEYVKSLKTNRDVLLIDVREPKELQETGILPGSINIPLSLVENALKNVPPEEFVNIYCRTKPTLTYPLVFSCRSGTRSEKAAKIAIALGYKNVSNYGGGWLDWEKHTTQSVSH